LVPTLNNPQGIAVDDTNVYYSETGIWQVAKTGGSPQNLAADSPQFLALDDAYVYWNGGASIRRVAKGGGGTVTAVVTPSQSPVGGVAVDATNVYWVGGGAFYSAPKDGSGSPVSLGSGVFDPEGGIGVPYSAAPSGPVLGAGTLAFSQDGSVWSVPVAGGSVSELVVDEGPASLITYGPVAASSTSIWYLHAIMDLTFTFISIAGGGDGGGLGAFPYAPILPPSGSFAVDSCALYFAFGSGSQGGVGRVLTSMSMVGQEIATGNVPNQIALDDSFVYWTDRDSVRQAAK
jgi:hypothetical protein